MEEKRYNLKELTEIYGVNRKTILKWTQELNFPLFTISAYKRYARASDLRQWENDTAQRTTIGSSYFAE